MIFSVFLLLGLFLIIHSIECNQIGKEDSHRWLIESVGEMKSIVNTPKLICVLSKLNTVSCLKKEDGSILYRLTYPDNYLIVDIKNLNENLYVFGVHHNILHILEYNIETSDLKKDHALVKYEINDISEIKIEVSNKGVLICIKNSCELLNPKLKSIYKFDGINELIDIKIDDNLHLLRNSENDNKMIIEEYSLLTGAKSEDISIDMKCKSSLMISNKDEKLSLLLLCLNENNELIIINNKEKEKENKKIQLDNLKENSNYLLEEVISSSDNNRLYNYFKIINTNTNEIENIGYLNDNNNTIDISNTIKGKCEFSMNEISCIKNNESNMIMIIRYKSDGFKEIERKEINVKGNNEEENHLFIINEDDILIQVNDKTIYYISKNEIKWNREEGLSYIKELEIMERNENENINDEIDDISFIRRMEDEIREVKEMIINEIDWIRNGFKMRNMKELEESNKYFGFNKYIIILSEYNVLYLLSSDNGKLLYKYDLIGNSHLLFRDEKSINIISEMNNNEIYIYTFIPSIQSLSHTVLPVNSKIEKIIRFSEVNNPIYGLIFNDLSVKIYPESDNEIEYYYVDVNKNNKIIKGYVIKGNNKDRIKSKLLYKMDLSYEEGEIVKYVIPNYNDKILKNGISGEDGSIIMKYNNMNTISIVIENKKSKCLVLYIMNLVNGKIIHNQRISDSSSPIGLNIIENWVILSYWNIVDIRSDILSISLTKDRINKNEINLSSLNKYKNSLSLKEIDNFNNVNISIEYKLFSFPMGIKDIYNSITLEGISSKYLIFILANNDIVEIESKYLDGLSKERKLSVKEEENGMIRYNAMLGYNTLNILNENESLIGIKGMKSSHAKIESTSIIVCYGNDLFYSHVMPIKPFDMLPSDFNFKILILVTIVLSVLTYILKLKVNEKRLKSEWF